MSIKVAVILIIIVSLLGYCAYKNDEIKSLKKEQSKLEKAESKARYERGPYVELEKKISEFETVKTIIYPGKEGSIYSDLFDTTCYVYVNTKINQSRMQCSGLYMNKDDDDENKHNSP